jgi:hypothetical protein
MANPNGNLANLRPPWKPGERVPGAGRPRKRPVSEAYDALLRSVAPAQVRSAMGLGKTATWADCIALGQARRAVRGDSTCAKEVREAVEGKATQRFEFTPTESGAPEFFVVYAPGIPGIPAKELPEAIIDVKPVESCTVESSESEDTRSEQE